MHGNETYVGRGTETRTFLYFDASARALAAFAPADFRIARLTNGPAAGANLMAAFVDQATSLDADDRPVDLMRYVLFEIAVQSTATGALAWMLFAGLSSGGAGVYGTNLRATALVERSVRHEPAGSTVEEAWHFDAGIGESVSLDLGFRRGPLSVQAVESHVHSHARPGFRRIYRTEQALDVVRPAGVASGETKAVFSARGAKLSAIFDGSERLAAIVSVPVYARRIYLPGS